MIIVFAICIVFVIQQISNNEYTSWIKQSTAELSEKTTSFFVSLLQCEGLRINIRPLWVHPT